MPPAAVSGPAQQLTAATHAALAAAPARLTGSTTVASHDVFFMLVTGALMYAARKQLGETFSKLIERTIDVLGSIGVSYLKESSFLVKYKQFLSSQHRFLKIIGFSDPRMTLPAIEEVFISLRVSPHDQSGDRALRESTEIPFEEAAKQLKRMIILGNPGAGKTTVLSYVVMQFVNKTMRSKLGIKEQLLPIFVPLRRVKKRNADLLTNVQTPDNQILSDSILPLIPKGYLEKKLRQGKCIVLLDGLDEVSDQDMHRSVSEQINAFVEAYPKNRFILTCRSAGWQGQVNQFTILEVKDFNQSEIHTFAAGWHRAVITQGIENSIACEVYTKAERQARLAAESGFIEAQANEHSRTILGAIEANGRLLAIAKNPMLLSLMCLLNYLGTEIPRNRSVLYEKCVEILVESRNTAQHIVSLPTLTSAQRHTILRSIALHLQANGKREITKSGICDIIARKLDQLQLDLAPERVLRDLMVRTGVIVEKSLEVYGFAHLTFQEYLVAKHFQTNPMDLPRLFDSLGNPDWRETVLLYAGLIEDATPLITEIYAEQTIERRLLAACALGEVVHCDVELARRIVDDVTRRLVELSEKPAAASAELKPADGGLSAIIDACSSICRDYTDNAVSPGQLLSQSLLELAQRTPALASPIVGCLSQARITKVIPFCLDHIRHNELIGKPRALRVIGKFGDLALPFINDAAGSFETPLLCEILCAIQTTQSAKFLISLYGSTATREEHYLISSALNRITADEIIEKGLYDLAACDVPASLTVERDDKDFIWPWPRRATKHFENVALKIRTDIVLHLRRFLESGDFLQLNVKLYFPALLYSLKRMEHRLSIAEWERLGFNVQNRADVKNLANVHRLLKSKDIRPRRSLARFHEDELKVSTRSASSLGIWIAAKRPFEILLTAIYAADATTIFCLICAWYPTKGLKNGYVMWLAVALVRVLFVAYQNSFARYANRKGRIIRSLVFPFPNVLQEVPYFSPLPAWSNFALATGSIFALSTPGLALFGIVETYLLPAFQGRQYTEVFEDFGVMLVALLPFVFTAVYFWKIVLSSDPSLQLLVHHRSWEKTRPKSGPYSAIRGEFSAPQSDSLPVLAGDSRHE